MKLRLTLRRDPDPARDLAVTVDGLATVSDVARELYVADPARAGAEPPGELSLTVEESYVAGGMRGRTLNPAVSLFESGLRPGSTVTISRVSDQFNVPGQDRGPAVATLRVLSGPDAGKEFSLPAGASYLGRDRNCDIRFSDPMMSKRHARINVADGIEIIDTNSANGLLMDGTRVARTALSSADEITLGDTTLAVVPLTRSYSADPTNPVIEFNRSPRVVPAFNEKPKQLPVPAADRAYPAGRHHVLHYAQPVQPHLHPHDADDPGGQLPRPADQWEADLPGSSRAIPGFDGVLQERH
jgi:DNA segregation ATPase FtsK/SpoIIIE, S-DNA-T family